MQHHTSANEGRENLVFTSGTVNPNRLFTRASPLLNLGELKLWEANPFADRNRRKSLSAKGFASHIVKQGEALVCLLASRAREDAHF